MKFGRPCPKCSSPTVERHEVLMRTRTWWFSQFEAFFCTNCGYTEFYRK